MAEGRPVLGRLAGTQLGHLSPPPLDPPNVQMGLLLTSGEVGDNTKELMSHPLHLPANLSIIS